jgi:hypothetical protein
VPVHGLCCCGLLRRVVGCLRDEEVARPVRAALVLSAGGAASKIVHRILIGSVRDYQCGVPGERSGRGEAA